MRLLMQIMTSQKYLELRSCNKGSNPMIYTLHTKLNIMTSMVTSHCKKMKEYETQNKYMSNSSWHIKFYSWTAIQNMKSMHAASIIIF